MVSKMDPMGMIVKAIGALSGLAIVAIIQSRVIRAHRREFEKRRILREHRLKHREGSEADPPD
jgi:hypothetical protein